MSLQNLLFHFENSEKLVIMKIVSLTNNGPSAITGPIPIRQIITEPKYCNMKVTDWKDKSTGILEVTIV